MGIDIVDITGCNSTGRPTPDETVKAKKLSPPKRAIYYLQPFKHRTYRDPYITHMRFSMYRFSAQESAVQPQVWSSLFSTNIAMIITEIIYYLNSNNLKPFYHMTCYLFLDLIEFQFFMCFFVI